MALFYELLRVALGNQETLSKTPSDSEWRSIYRAAQKQTVVGFAFEALERLHNKGIRPPQVILYEWIGSCEQIKKQNILLNKRCIEVTQLVEKAGFRSCILKGQGNAFIYPDPLSRTSGDIDIWMEGGKSRVRDFVKSRFPNAKEEVLHFNYPVFNDVPVEVHYKPQYLSSPKYDRRLQKWFNENAEKQFDNKITTKDTGAKFCVPTPDFNFIVQLTHVTGHFFHGGIGMRHMIDLYYVLKAIKPDEQEELSAVVDSLGLTKFACGLMWVLQETLGLDRQYMIVEPLEEVGVVVLNEINGGGNFGRYKSKDQSLRGRSLLGKGVVFVKRQYRMTTIYPAEAVWQVIQVGKHVVNKYVLKKMKKMNIGLWQCCRYLVYY